MALPTYKLGEFVFLSLDPFPDLTAEELELIARLGVPNVAALRTGRRGQPFVFVSRVDTDDLQAATQLMEDYKAFVGSDPAPLTWADQQLGNVLVLGVRPVRVQAIIAGVGGLSANSGGWLVAEWTVVAMTPVTA